MIDVFNTPNNTTKTQVFYSNGISNSWITWSKPAGCSFVNFTVIGGGGGGGGGRTSSSATAAGGGGGGSSSITTASFPAALLPDTLYIQVGSGGAGGVNFVTQTNGGAGGSGSLSYVSISANSNSQFILLASGAVAAGGGAGGTNTGGSSGGAAGTVFAYATNVFSNLGIVNTFAGQIGGNSDDPATPALVANITITSITSAGAGGGGISSSHTKNGGSITGSGFVPSVNGGSTGVTINQIIGTSFSSTGLTKSNGSDGYFTNLPSPNLFSKNPMLFTGGAGGGAGGSAPLGAGSGGYGGAGSYGSGGGGGGGAYISGVGGKGGSGGDGIVIITCW